MQTFLPYKSFEETAKVLDMRRLGKQRVEGYQIIRTLLGYTSGWANHPAVKMWEGHEIVLLKYTWSIIDEWVYRGYVDNIHIQLQEIGNKHFGAWEETTISIPVWLGDENFHLSHKSNLIRKFPEYYGSIWPDVPDDLPYIWPIK